MFHTENGLFFEPVLIKGERKIRIVRTSDAKEPNGDNTVLEQTISAGSFASAFCSCSPSGENAGRWYIAVALLEN
jgi:hypothetical protein